MLGDCESSLRSIWNERKRHEKFFAKDSWQWHESEPWGINSFVLASEAIFEAYIEMDTQVNSIKIVNAFSFESSCGQRADHFESRS